MTNELIVIGGGNMASAILTRAIEQGIVARDALLVVEPNADRRKHFQTLGTQAFASCIDIRDRLRPEATILLAIKPQMLASVAEEIADLGFSGLVISILAGMGSQRVRSALGGKCRVVRVMPNTPAQVGMGVSAISADSGASESDLVLTKAIFEGVGDVVRVDEDMMDAVTAVSGSGPAYVFLLAQAMIEGATSVGLDGETARRLVVATMRGGAEMLVQSEDTPEQLRRAVTSPGGTTEAAIREMEAHDWRGIVARAVRMARDRGMELGRS